MRATRIDRTNKSFGYTGSGNKTLNYNRRPKRVFSVLKAYYGEELERLKNTHPGKRFLQHLSTEERMAIRKRVRRSFIKKRRLDIGIRIMLLVIMAIVVVLIIRALGA